MYLNYIRFLSLFLVQQQSSRLSPFALTRSRDYYILPSSSTLLNSNRRIVRLLRPNDGQQYTHTHRRTVENGYDVLRKSNISKKNY